ncbi:MAG: DNA/RNA nuclease SfsA [Gammaproteobacteria bacterium]
MQFPPLTRGKILSRYKRFLADVELEDGRVVTAHCPNTGSMTGCWAPGAPVELSASDNPKRKLKWTLERIDMGQGWVGVNTSRTNQIINAFIAGRKVPGLDQFDQLKREPAYTAEGFPRSRFDLLLMSDRRPHCYVEVKNTTLWQDGQIQFPDAVTERGRKHLLLLSHAVDAGFRGVILFALNRPEGEVFSAARNIDPEYADTLAEVIDNGVEAMAVRIRHTPKGVRMGGLVPIAL